MPFADAFTQLVLEKMRANPETDAMIQKYSGGREVLRPNIDLRRGLEVCDTEAKVLLYCHKYMHAHYDAYLHVLRAYDDLVQNRLFKDNSRPVFIDIGCGPMTSGLALADYYRETHKERLVLTYVGIDNCELMLKKAQEFAEHPGMFGSDSHFVFAPSWNDIKLNRPDGYLRDNTNLALNFSYLFGQEIADADLNNLIAFVKRFIADYKANRPLIIFLNAAYSQANIRYRRFKKGLGFTGYIEHFSKVPTRWMMDFNQLEYQEPSKNNICFEILSF